MKKFCLYLAVAMLGLLLLCGAVSSALLVYRGDMIGLSFWLAIVIAGLLIYGTSN